MIGVLTGPAIVDGKGPLEPAPLPHAYSCLQQWNCSPGKTRSYLLVDGGAPPAVPGERQVGVPGLRNPFRVAPDVASDRQLLSVRRTELEIPGVAVVPVDLNPDLVPVVRRALRRQLTLAGEHPVMPRV